MPNDDLGQFPTPPKLSDDDLNYSVTTPTTSDPPQSPATPPETTLLEDISTPPTTTPPESPAPQGTFEPTPDEIPSVTPTEPVTSTFAPPEVFPESPVVIPAAESPALGSRGESIQINSSTTPSTPPQPPQEIPATIVPKGGPSFGPVILIALLLLAGIGLAASVFLFSQSQQLKGQLLEITQTLEKQKTVITPSPTPSEVEVITPSLTPVATISSTPTPFLSPTATPTAILTPTASGLIMPLASAPQALRVAINHEPNAQLILIKTGNATDPVLALTKYYFRQSLTVKKYFYGSMNIKGESQVVDTAIYVTPDNNIPSLNDMVLGNSLGIDFDQALKISTDLCPGTTCTTATVKAQYIKSGDIVIWQLTFDPQDTSKANLVIQMNAQTKEVLYKSTGFK